MTAEIHYKKFWGPNWGRRDQNQTRNQGFCYFLQFGLLVFLEIAYIDSLQQCMSSFSGKTRRKILGIQIWVKQAKIGSKIRFLSFFQVWFISFSGNCTGLQLATLSNYQQRKRPIKKIGAPKLGPKLGFLAFS